MEGIRKKVERSSTEIKNKNKKTNQGRDVNGQALMQQQRFGYRWSE